MKKKTISKKKGATDSTIPEKEPISILDLVPDKKEEVLLTQDQKDYAALTKEDKERYSKWRPAPGDIKTVVGWKIACAAYRATVKKIVPPKATITAQGLQFLLEED